MKTTTSFGLLKAFIQAMAILAPLYSGVAQDSAAVDASAAIKSVEQGISDANEDIVAESIAKKLEQKWGRAPITEALAGVVGRFNLDTVALNASRILGRRLSPEFYVSASRELSLLDDPEAKRRLVTLLRDGEPEVVKPALIPLLCDMRRAETLNVHDQSQRYNSMRVCDVAFNVLQQKLVLNATDAPRVRGSESDASRDKEIAKLCVKLGVPVPSAVSPTPAANSADSSGKGEPVTTSKNGIRAEKPERGNTRERSWLVWLLVVIAATLGAVWVFLHRSK